MSSWYLDTSAAMKLLVSEAESEVLAATITDEQPDLVGCYLLETEVRRSVQAHGLAQSAATELLEGVSLYEMPPFLFREAGLLVGEHVRSPDALHVAAAIQIGADQVIAYDRRMSAAARDSGLTVRAPGAV